MEPNSLLGKFCVEDKERRKVLDSDVELCHNVFQLKIHQVSLFYLSVGFPSSEHFMPEHVSIFQVRRHVKRSNMSKMGFLELQMVIGAEKIVFDPIMYINFLKAEILEILKILKFLCPEGSKTVF